MTSSILTAFNDHFMEFVNDIHTVFPNDPDILTAKNSFSAIRKANPKLIIKIWVQFIVNKYKDVIEAGNIDFFISKDYSQDVSGSEYASKIMEAIDRLRNPVKLMTSENQAKTMKYIQNLTKLATIFDASS